MEKETLKLILKRRPDFKQMNDILDFQRHGVAEKITFRTKDQTSEISITATVEERKSIVNFLKSRNLVD